MTVNIERRKATQRKYRMLHKKEINEYYQTHKAEYKTYYQLNKEKCKAYQKAYYDKKIRRTPLGTKRDYKQPEVYAKPENVTLSVSASAIFD